MSNQIKNPQVICVSDIHYETQIDNKKYFELSLNDLQTYYKEKRKKSYIYSIIDFSDINPLQ